MTSFSFAAEPAQSPPPSSTISAPLSMSRQVRDASAVDDDAMSDAERESEIARHGRGMIAAYARYEASSCFTDVGQAHFHRMRMYALIRGRSAGQVAAMEQARGLA